MRWNGIRANQDLVRNHESVSVFWVFLTACCYKITTCACFTDISTLSLSHPLSSSSLVFSLCPRQIPSLFSLSLALSLPVLQCDVTIRELMYRILRVLHSSFPTHTAQYESQSWYACTQSGWTLHHRCCRPRTPRQFLSLVCSLRTLQAKWSVRALGDGVQWYSIKFKT